MATALKLRSDINKLKKALLTKGISDSVKSKLKNQLERAESELNTIKKTGKAPKRSSVKSTKTALTALQKLVNRKKYSVYKGAGVDLEKDAGQGALATGKRISKGLKANQNGDKGSNKGNVYYEYRPNHLDVKQPKKKQTYPKLEYGGMMAKGGINAANLVIGKKYEYDYAKDGTNYKIEYLGTKEDLKNKRLKIDFKIGSGGYVFKFDNDKIVELSKPSINKILSEMEYADGGMMAKGGSLDSKLKKYATEDVNLLQKEGGMAITDTKLGVIFGEHKGGVFTFTNRDGKNLFSGNKEETIEFVKNNYQVEGMASGGYMAMGGALEHGLKVGDVVKLISGNSIAIYNTKDKNSYRVNISEGKREMVSDMDFEEYASGGKVKVGDTLTASTGVKVKVVEYDPMFGGRVKIERMDEYATGKPSQWMPLSKFKMADGGMMADKKFAVYAFDGKTNFFLDNEGNKSRVNYPSDIMSFDTTQEAIDFVKKHQYKYTYPLTWTTSPNLENTYSELNRDVEVYPISMMADGGIISKTHKLG